MTSEDSPASICEKFEAMKTASDLLAQGKRNMVCGEVPKAVDLYEEAVQLLVKSCGEMSRDCADAYYCCGSALLELGRMETNVLGVALEGVEVEEEKEEEVSEQFEKPPADEGEERQKLRVEVYEAMAEGEREEEFEKVLLEKTKETSVEKEGKKEFEKVLPEKIKETSEGKGGLEKVLPEETKETLVVEEGKEESQKVLPEKTKETSVAEEGKEESQKVLPEKTKEPAVVEEGKEEFQKLLPDKTKETAVVEEGKEESQKVLPDKTTETAVVEEGKEEIEKVLPEKTNKISAEGLDVCDKSVGAASMETDAVAEKGEDITVNKAEVIDEQSSNNAGSEEKENISVSANDSSTPEEKTDNCHAGNAHATERLDSSTAGDKKCEDGSTSTMDECKPDKIDDIGVEVTEKCKPDKIDDIGVEVTEKCKPDKIDTGVEITEKCNSNEENACVVASTQEKVVDGAVEIGNITDVSGSNPAIDQEKNVNASANDECVPEEIMDTSENEHVTEKPGSSTEGDKETDTALVGAEGKKEEVISSSSAENKTVAEEVGSGTENINLEESRSNSEGSKQEEETKNSEQGAKQVKDTSDNAEKVRVTENVETEAVLDSDQKIENKETEVVPVHAENKEKILADPAVSSEAEENADVEMADNDEMDVGEDEAEDDDDVNTDDIQEIEGNEDEKEEVPNFQLAWEYLDLAKVLYLKSDTANDQLKAAECHMKLGELSMETGQHAIAAEDLGSALKIQQKYLPANDRLIAETLYQLGLAYGLSGEYEQSIQHYTQATGVIESKIESLNKLVQDKEANGENKENAELGECAKYLEEIKELQELIPEIKNKIEDTNQEAKDMEQLKHAAKEALAICQLSKATASPTKHLEPTMTDNNGVVDENSEGNKVSDITHMVRKKRKPEDDVSDNDVLEVKKIRPDGDCPSNAAQNNGTSQLETNNIVEGCNLKQNEDSCVASVEPVVS